MLNLVSNAGTQNREPGLMNIHSVVTVSPDQVSCDLGGETAILNIKTGTYYGLDPLGARIWTLMAAPTSVAAIRDAILEEYEVEPARCEADVLELLSKLAAEGLIEISAA